MKLAFKKPKTLIQKFIAWWIRHDMPIKGKRFYHVELILDDGTAFSATTRDGTRYISSRFLGYQDCDKWEVVELPVCYKTEIKKEVVLRRIQDILDLKYDYLGLFFQQGLKMIHIDDKKKFYCSEAIAYCLGSPVKMNPHQLYVRYTYCPVNGDKDTGLF